MILTTAGFLRLIPTVLTVVVSVADEQFRHAVEGLPATLHAVRLALGFCTSIHTANISLESIQ